MIGDAKTFKDKLDKLEQRVFALDTQGIPLLHGELAALTGRIEALEAQVREIIGEQQNRTGKTNL